ncbi:MAG: serine protease [Balneolaceae bacterium]
MTPAIFQRTGLRVRLNALILILASALFLLTCTRTVYEYERPEKRDGRTGYYDSRSPIRNISNEIEEIFGAVKRIQITGYFYTYLLDSNELFTQDDLRNGDLKELAVDVTYSNQSKSGTSIVLSNSRTQSALLTAGHVVSYPDTIWHFVKSPDLEPETYVEAITVLDRQTNLVIGSSSVNEFDIIIRDTDRDVAILRTRTHNGQAPSLRTLQIRPGNANRLNWANTVYLMGYPKGMKMVTTGLVSLPRSSLNSNFMMDAVFNPGFSGGLILAIREDTGDFEWMGIATSSLAEFETFLTPEDDFNEDFDPEIPYRNDLYIRREARINYGMTQTLSINEIRDFLNEYRNRIEQSGLDVSGY